MYAADDHFKDGLEQNHGADADVAPVGKVRGKAEADQPEALGAAVGDVVDPYAQLIVIVGGVLYEANL